MAYALPDRMVLVYTTSPAGYFVTQQRARAPLLQGRRELAYRTRCDLALGDSAYNRQSSKRSASRPPASSMSCPVSIISAVRAISVRRELRR
jgi:hypothetical protein